MPVCTETRSPADRRNVPDIVDWEYAWDETLPRPAYARNWRLLPFIYRYAPQYFPYCVMSVHIKTYTPSVGQVKIPVVLLYAPPTFVMIRSKTIFPMVLLKSLERYAVKATGELRAANIDIHVYRNEFTSWCNNFQSSRSEKRLCTSKIQSYSYYNRKSHMC